MIIRDNKVMVTELMPAPTTPLHSRDATSYYYYPSPRTYLSLSSSLILFVGFWLCLRFALMRALSIRPLSWLGGFRGFPLVSFWNGYKFRMSTRIDVSYVHLYLLLPPVPPNPFLHFSSSASLCLLSLSGSSIILPPSISWRTKQQAVMTFSST